MHDLPQLLAYISFIAVICLYVGLRREKRRTRVLGAFIAGLIVRELDREVPYEELLFYVTHEFEADFWAFPAKRFLKHDRNLFFSEPMGNGGFNLLFWDFFDREKSMFETAGLSDSKHVVAASERLADLLRSRAVQIVQSLRRDYQQERLWRNTGSDETYRDLRMHEENRDAGPGTPAPR